MVELIEEKRETGVFLFVIGVGTGNLNNAMMEQVANHGNGTYEYIDDITQAQKIFVDEYNKLITVAKDVKVQVTFNTQVVHSYRLIGYENRVLDEENFEDDTEDAGEIGSGQCITALYEIVPREGAVNKASYPFSIDFRYKLPDEDTSNQIELSVRDNTTGFENASENTRFAAAFAAFGMILSDSEYKGDATIRM